MFSPSYDSSLVGETELFLVFAVFSKFQNLMLHAKPTKI